MKITHTLAARQALPPSGTYMYRTSHRLYDACQLRQKPWDNGDGGVVIETCQRVGRLQQTG